MSNLNKLNGWTGYGGYTSRTSAQSYLASKTNNMNSSSCGSSCGSKDGDPILHSRFWDLMEMFKSHNIAFTILGNPFHLNDEVCFKLKNYGCERYQLSIDGLMETDNANGKVVIRT